ncbi:MAG: hypothetical protein AB7N71_02255 [Phycisphaerae bacterium]
MRSNEQHKNPKNTGVSAERAAQLQSGTRLDWTVLGTLVRVEAARRAENSVPTRTTIDITDLFRDRFGGRA